MVAGGAPSLAPGPSASFAVEAGSRSVSTSPLRASMEPCAGSSIVAALFTGLRARGFGGLLVPEPLTASPAAGSTAAGERFFAASRVTTFSGFGAAGRFFARADDAAFFGGTGAPSSGPRFVLLAAMAPHGI